MPPKPIVYPPPKNVGGKPENADITARAMLIEKFDTGEYCIVLDRLFWRKDGHEELRFTYYYRKKGGTDSDWIFGQGAAHMNPKTLVALIRKAKTNPDWGNFENSLGGISIMAQG